MILTKILLRNMRPWYYLLRLSFAGDGGKSLLDEVAETNRRIKHFFYPTKYKYRAGLIVARIGVSIWFLENLCRAFLLFVCWKSEKLVILTKCFPDERLKLVETWKVVALNYELRFLKISCSFETKVVINQTTTARWMFLVLKTRYILICEDR